MTGNDIILSVSNDVRQVLGIAGSAQLLLQDYVDRIQKDALHDSIYAYLNATQTVINTVVGTTTYTLPSDIRAIRNVYDRTRERLILPLQITTLPAGQVQGAPMTAQGRQPEMQALPREQFRLKTVSTGEPEYWQQVGATALYLYSTPQKILVIEVVYQKRVSTVSDPTITLTLPDDAKDMMVAGVNYLANLYLGREQPSNTWMQLYSKLKAGESLA